ncbi:hypothetical protein [Methylobacterium oxalidis]|uniref:Anti-sigma factor NepR domain-containing protein n=1 Tax=Methylobacterium oxalidis TaxID=944322 RepID=A0A512J597_9HYPH|nr:hypothetical protein [Methylobacterium oxalidis]GEP05080.1 hypothetical protein MOX02_31180 [Methylobacterium oxalidis]GJE34774.1 hypothetical protein LDDCCGHA_4989 [Methylobacterium oxalidis]GLS65641.1 hypothetical protein GCM10007888_40230 [Methylobacterium oxalidis]
MKPVALNHAANYRRPGTSSASIAETLLLAKIGEDLREVYRAVAVEAQPAHLAQLAHRLDAKRGR